MSAGSRLIAGSEVASICMARRQVASASGAVRVAHQPSTAWSTARMPVESMSSSGVSRVASGSRITAFGTDSGCWKPSLTLRAGSVIPACGENSAADSVVGIAIMRSRCGSSSQALDSGMRLAASLSRSADSKLRHSAISITFVASITEPPPTATIRSASAARIAFAPAITASRGLCAAMSWNLPANRSPSSAITPATRFPLVKDRVVVTKTRRARERSSSLASASRYGTP